MSAVDNAYTATAPAGTVSLWADKARLRRVLMFGGVGLFLAIAGERFI